MDGVDRRPWALHDFTLIRETNSGLWSSSVLARRNDSRERAVITYLFSAGFPDASTLECIRADTEALRWTEDPHLIRTRGYRLGPHGVAVISEAVPGLSLREILRAVRILPLEAAVVTVVQALEGIIASQEAGVLCRSITPESVMISADGLVKVEGCDWSAVVSGAGATQAGGDTHAAACLLLECLTGRPPLLGGPACDDGLPAQASTTEAGGSLRPLLRQALSQAVSPRPVRAREFAGAVKDWSTASLDTGWEARGRAELGRVVSELMGGTPPPPALVHQRRRSLRQARLASVGVALSMTVAATAVVAQEDAPQQRSLPARDSTGLHAVPKRGTIGAPAHEPSPQALSPSATTAASPAPTVQGKRVRTVPPSSGPTMRTPHEIPAPANGTLSSVRAVHIVRLRPDPAGNSIEAVVSVTATTTAPFTVTISWYDAATGGTLASPGVKSDRSWSIQLRGSRRYLVTADHPLTASVCHHGIRAQTSPPPVHDEGYRAINMC
ncbi:hypothetical protein [Streptomyces sp. NPDC055709]